MSKPISKIVKSYENHIVKTTSPAPAIREIKEVVAPQESNGYVTAYKDLNQPQRDFANNQKKHLFVAFFVFLILGIGIMMGQSLSKNRVPADASLAKLIPRGAEATKSEHEHYDKVCYKGEDGEQICMTRTSQKR